MESQTSTLPPSLPEGDATLLHGLCRFAAGQCDATAVGLCFGDGAEAGVITVGSGTPQGVFEEVLAELDAAVRTARAPAQRTCADGGQALGVPLKTEQGGELLGVMILLGPPGAVFAQEALKLVAQQAAAVLELSQVRLALAEKNRMTALRAQLGPQLAGDRPLPEVITRCAQTLIGYFPQATLRLWTLAEDGERFELAAQAGLPASAPELVSLPVTEGRLGELRHGSLWLNRPSFQDDPCDPRDPEDPRPWEAIIGCPMQLRERLAGVLTLYTRQPLAPLILADLKIIADRFAQTILHLRTKASLERSEEVARFLARASADLAEVTDYQSTLHKIASASVPDFADWCAIYLLEGEQLLPVGIAHPDPEKVARALEITQSRPLTVADFGEAAGSGKAELLEFLPDDRLVRVAGEEGDDLDHIRSLGLRSALTVPLMRRGEMFGLLTFYTAESGRLFDSNDLATAEDLARRAAVAIENASLYQQLQDADRQKDEFLAMLAHELRNPLAPITNGIELLRQNGARPPTETLDMMSRQLRQMVRLIDDLFDISRIKHNRMRLIFGQHDLRTIIRSAVESCQPQLTAAGHTFHLDLPESPLPVHADAARLAQVVSNLLGNAIKYTGQGGEITLSARAESPQECVIRLKDNGIGIDPGMLRRIFDLYSQVRDSLESSQGGMGIGLTLVHRLVEMHRGRVEALSDGPGLGSEFVIQLPLTTPLEEGAPQPSAARTPASEGGPRCRLLVVDDNRDATLTLARLLERNGYEVRTAFDGPEAITAAREFKPRLILLDIGLPSLNGYDTARVILRDLSDPPPILVAMTGWGQEHDQRRSREAGFTRHLIKPVDFDDLKAELERLLV